MTILKAHVFTEPAFKLALPEKLTNTLCFVAKTHPNVRMKDLAGTEGFLFRWFHLSQSALPCLARQQELTDLLLLLDRLPPMLEDDDAEQVQIFYQFLLTLTEKANALSQHHGEISAYLAISP